MSRSRWTPSITSVVTHEVTNTVVDRTLLSPMAGQAKAAMGAERIDVLADRGYFSGEEILACEAINVTPYVPKPREPRRPAASARMTSSTTLPRTPIAARRARRSPIAARLSRKAARSTLIGRQRAGTAL